MTETNWRAENIHRQQQTKWPSRVWPDDLMCSWKPICIFEPTINTQNKSTSLHSSHQRQALMSSSLQWSLTPELQTIAGNIVQWMQTSQRPRKLVNSALNFSRPHFSVFSSHRLELHTSGPTEGSFTEPSAAASCGRISTENFNRGSRDLKVQPEWDAGSPGPAIVLGRDLISRPGLHSPCKCNQKEDKYHSEQRLEFWGDVISRAFGDEHLNGLRSQWTDHWMPFWISALFSAHSSPQSSEFIQRLPVVKR